MSKELEEIKKVYYEINNELSGKINTQETRYETLSKILIRLEKSLESYSIRVICDETNNTPELIDKNQLVAMVEWKSPDKYDSKINYIELIFGDVDFVWN